MSVVEREAERAMISDVPGQLPLWPRPQEVTDIARGVWEKRLLERMRRPGCFTAYDVVSSNVKAMGRALFSQAVGEVEQLLQDWRDLDLLMNAEFALDMDTHWQPTRTGRRYARVWWLIQRWDGPGPLVADDAGVASVGKR